MTNTKSIKKEYEQIIPKTKHKCPRNTWINVQPHTQKGKFKYQHNIFH